MAEESKLRVVVFGKTGTGKSSLINSLFLSKDSSVSVATEGHGLLSETKSVGCYTKMVTMIVNDVHVTLWDTPGLKDPHSDGEKTIKEIGDGCDIGDIDLFVYCTHFDQPRLEKDDVDCIQDITKAFGDRIWKRALFALTFANQATLPPSVTDKSLSEYFPFRLEQWRKGLHHFVKEHARELSSQAISSIPVVPASYKNLPLPDNRFWLLEFWSACVAQVKFFSLPAMKRMADDQIKGEAERTAIAGEFEKRMAKEPESADKAQVARGLASLPGSANHGSTVITSSVDSVDSPDCGIPNDSSTPGKSGNAESTDGSNGAQGFVGKKLKEYLDKLAKIGIGGCMLDVKDDLEAYVGKELKGKNVQKTMEEIDFDISEAEITSIKLVDYPTEIKEKQKLTNEVGGSTVKYGPIVITKTDATEEWKEKTRGWSFSPTVGVSHYGSASCAFVYSRSKGEKSVVREASGISASHEKEIPLEVGSSIMAAVEVKTKCYIINVKKLLLEFPSNTELKVNRWPWSKEKLSNILVIRDEKDGKIIAESEGTVQIMEVTSSVETYPMIENL